MRLTCGDSGDRYELLVEPTHGPHTVALTIANRVAEVTYPLRPDEAVALAGVLLAWAFDRQEKEGLF